MAPSLGLSLYLLVNRRSELPQAQPPQAPRPPGLLVWIAVENPGRTSAALTLAQTMLARGIADHVLVTSAEPQTHPPDGVTVLPPPEDVPDHARMFFDHWKPDLGLILGDVLRPALISEAQTRRIGLMLIEAGHPALPDGRRWYPGLISGMLGAMQAILVRDDPALQDYRRAGAPAALLHLSAPLDETGLCPPATEAERRALSAQFGTRPVWLAVAVPEAEERAALDAHLTALRATHRLLLILVPDDPARGPVLAELAKRLELTCARRSLDQEPDEDVQVYIADTDGEYGLWYRLAPLCYLGGTLGTGTSRTPFEAASLGSAIVHGPFLGGQDHAFTRLRRAGATRIAPSAGDLGDTISDLLEPERVARLAQAAWGVLARSAEASEDVLRRVAALLPPRGTGE
jgi:3-deoxy-D-manno-octulosonic-acid transferase